MLKPIALTADERRELEGWVRRPSTAQALAMRARIVLAAADSPEKDNVTIGNELRLNRNTVGRWRRRFLKKRVAGLLDEPRPGAPRTYGDDKIEALIAKTLETKPEDATHWSTRSMASAIGMSQSTISRVWRAFNLKPHRSEVFKLSTDPLFVEKVRDIVGLYLDPPDKALVLCVDEKTQIQALDRTQPSLPLAIGHGETRTHDYIRYGTTSLFAALSVKTGQVIGELFRRHRAREFKKFLDTIESQVPADLDVHVILDNSSTHKTPAIKTWLRKHPRFHFHFTPTSSSWINLVERWFAALTDKQIKRGAHRSTEALEDAIRRYVQFNNDHPRPYTWTKSADEILGALGRLCSRISDSGH